MDLYDTVELAGNKGRIVAIFPGFWVILWQSGDASKIKIGSCSVRRLPSAS